MDASSSYSSCSTSFAMTEAEMNDERRLQALDHSLTELRIDELTATVHKLQLELAAQKQATARAEAKAARHHSELLDARRQRTLDGMKVSDARDHAQSVRAALNGQVKELARSQHRVLELEGDREGLVAIIRKNVAVLVDQQREIEECKTLCAEREAAVERVNGKAARILAGAERIARDVPRVNEEMLRMQDELVAVAAERDALEADRVELDALMARMWTEGLGLPLPGEDEEMDSRSLTRSRITAYTHGMDASEAEAQIEGGIEVENHTEG